MKKVVLIITIILGILVCLIPIVCVIIVSNKEMDKFKVDTKYDLKERAYGELVTPTRSDIKEYYTVAGEITSDTVRFMRIPECNYSNIKWLVEAEQEVATGEKIGFCEDIDIYSSCDGIIKEIDCMGEEPSVKVQTFEQLLFKAMLPMDMETKMREVMYDKAGNELKLIKKSRQYTEEGVAVSYKIGNAKNYRYGQKIEKFDMYTGEVFSDVLVLPKSCIYKSHDDKSYVRVCDDGGYFIREQEIKVGFEIGEFISVTGISEDEQCDSGYSYVQNDEDIPSDIELAVPMDGGEYEQE